jgi:hypothetical protein
MVHWTRSECVSCETVGSCKTLYGATTCGCQKSTCVKVPTGEMCARLVPVVRWVTYNVCHECNHGWSDEVEQVGQLQERRVDSESSQLADSNDEPNEMAARAASPRSPRLVSDVRRLLGFTRTE